MKNKFVLITASLLIVSLSVIFGFTNKPASGGILTMRTLEANGMVDNSISIVYENGKVEKIELSKLSGRDHTQNLLIINETINRLQSSGYHLISTAGGGDGISSICTTYTFEKE
jgi:hypothetical protein